MFTKTFKNIVRWTIIYSYILSLPIASFFNLTHSEQNDLLLNESNNEFGDNSEVVRLIQYKLNHLGYYDDLIDGEYELLTQYAVKQFQSSHNINVTGNTDKQTMETLLKAEKESYLKELNDVIHSIDYHSDPDEITDVQEKLYYLGHYKGNIDGIYGPLTDEAIKEVYQENITYFNNDQNNEQNNDVIEDDHLDENDEHQSIDVQYQVKQSDINIIDTAHAYIGTPYVWGGQSPTGFDCSGFVQFVYSEQNKTIPRTVSEIWNYSESIQSPSVGDLVFFETYKAGPSHLGIYLGNGEFIHAGASRGVEVSSLDNSYWSSNYIGAKRIN